MKLRDLNERFAIISVGNKVRQIGNLPVCTTLELEHITDNGRGARANVARIVGQVDVTTTPEQTTDLRGYVARLRLDRGFGHIRTEPVGEYFFHKSDCRSLDFDLLEEGQQVVFDAVLTERGPRAINIGLL